MTKGSEKNVIGLKYFQSLISATFEEYDFSASMGGLWKLNLKY